ncbi:MAG: hypothetical protein LBI62_08175 [Candidatus Accumulibacter sp.]|nr:hypothetical protein [Accumulibacter sp.]
MPPVAARMRRSGIRDQGSGIRDQGSGIRDQGSGIRDQGSEIHGRFAPGKDAKPCAPNIFAAAKPPVTSSDT